MHSTSRPDDALKPGHEMRDVALDDNALCIHVTAPSRLHFGLLSFGGDGSDQSDAQRRFGGLGLMIQQPGLRLTFRPAKSFEAHGPLAQRAAEFARRFAASIGRAAALTGRIEIISAPPEHIGLGTGTQLALAVASGLNALWSESPREPVELARLVGRGARSAIGTHGFAKGGLVFEQGKLPEEPVSELTKRVDFPATWRLVLLRPRDRQGLSGEAEQAAFAHLQAVPKATTEYLARLARDTLLPAAADAEFGVFSRALFQYGHTAGACYAGVQPGAYASREISDLIDWLKSRGIEGSGQSSWGPTVYALTPTEREAHQLIDDFQRTDRAALIDCQVVAADNHGARLLSERR